jgi:hypothetical protein
MPNTAVEPPIPAVSTPASVDLEMPSDTSFSFVARRARGSDLLSETTSASNDYRSLNQKPRSATSATSTATPIGPSPVATSTVKPDAQNSPEVIVESPTPSDDLPPLKRSLWKRGMDKLRGR